MMKKSLIVVSLLFVSTNSFAQNEYFMGVGIGSVNWTPKVIITNNVGTTVSKTSENDNSGMFSISGGTIIDDKHKFTIGYTAYKTKSDIDANSIDLSYAYYIDQDSLKITNKKWKPFIGAGYTMFNYKEKLPSSYNKSEFNLKTKAIMLSIGTDYKIDKKQFLTVGYALSLHTSGSDSATFTTGGNNYNANIETDKTSIFSISYNYKF